MQFYSTYTEAFQHNLHEESFDLKFMRNECNSYPLCLCDHLLLNFTQAGSNSQKDINFGARSETYSVVNHQFSVEIKLYGAILAVFYKNNLTINDQ